MQEPPSLGADLWGKGVKGRDMAVKREMKRHLRALNPPELKNTSNLCLEHTVFSINGFSWRNQWFWGLYTKMHHFRRGAG